MSVTFWIPDAPREEKPCEWCEKARAEGWDENGRCDRFCAGSTLESTGPEANFSNGNARDVLGLLGLLEDPNDMWGLTDGATLRQRIFKARNTDRSHLERDAAAFESGHAGTRVVNEGNVARIERMGPAVFVSGNSDAQTLRRLADLERVACWAQEHGYLVSWG